MKGNKQDTEVVLESHCILADTVDQIFAMEPENYPREW